MTKHTPGPWIVDENYLRDNDNELCVCVFGPEGQGYGRVAMAYGECGCIEEVMPNARLIAAAPETVADRDRLKSDNAVLLDILKDSIQFVAKWTNDHDSMIGRCQVQRMEAAILASRNPK